MSEQTPSGTAMKPMTAAKKLGIYLPATPQEFQDGAITHAELRELQDKWDEIGFVPRGRVREYEDKIARIEQRVSEAEDSRWRKTNPAQQDKVNQFQVKADD